MYILSIIASVLSSIFSSAIMLYISLATPFGPWIEPAVALVMLLFLQMTSFSDAKKKEIVACAVVSAGISGIAAVGSAFSYPTLFFTDPSFFNEWVTHSGSFIVSLFLLIFVAGMWAFFLVHATEKHLLGRDDLGFPIAQIVNKLLIAKNAFGQGLQLVAGAVISSIFSIFYGLSYVPKFMVLSAGHMYSGIRMPMISINIQIFPLLMALGFITGQLLLIPLILGTLSKIILVDQISTRLFPFLKNQEIVVAWCSGMAIFSAAMGLWSALKGLPLWWSHTKNFSIRSKLSTTSSFKILLYATFVIAFCFFWYFQFSGVAIGYLLFFSLIAAYQLILIAGRIGLAPLGRFATFVMMPGLLFFGYTPLQMTQVAAFVELCGGIAVDCMFGRKLAQLSNITRKSVIGAQLIGLVVGAITISFLFWVVGARSELGVVPLVAQRAYIRSLLVGAYNLHGAPMVLGALFAYVMHRFHINVILVMSGFLMPLDYILPLVVGGTLSSFSKNAESWFPFWSGVFAAASIFMVLKTLI